MFFFSSFCVGLKFGTHKVDMLKVVNAKLQSNPVSAALKMMDSPFSTEELVNGNPSGITKSRDSIRRATVQALDPGRIKYIFGTYMHVLQLTSYRHVLTHMVKISYRFLRTEVTRMQIG